MPTADREAVIGRTDLKPNVKKNILNRPWNTLNKDIQGKLTAAMATPAVEHVPEAQPAAAPKKSPKQRAEESIQARADYFTPGNIVQGYSGHDRVISYKAPDGKGEGWSVTVQAVVKQDGQWVVDPKDDRVRTHSTHPDARELAKGPAERVKVSDQKLEHAPEPEPAKHKPKRHAGARNLRAVGYGKNPLMAFLATHGLYHERDKAGSQKSEYSPDKSLVVSGYGPVFKRTGKQPSDLVVQAIQDGYLPQDGTVEQLDALIRRAIAGERISPLYSEGAAEAEMQARMDADFEDFVQSELDSSGANDYDPFDTLSELGFTLSDAEQSGYSEADDPIKIEVNALLQQAETLGIDIDTIKEDAHYANPEGSDQDYYEAARSALQDAIATSRGDSSTNAGSTGNAGAQDEGLTPTTPEQVKADEERAAATEKSAKAHRAAQDLIDKRERERKDIAKASEAAADTFTLGGDAEQNLSGQQDVFGAPETAPKPSANTIFTEDAAAAARARLKAKLGRANAGLDPEMMLDGITLAGYHIEKGARSFAAYARAMIGDLGDGVKPYLKSWYMALKYDPRSLTMEGMDSATVVENFKEEDFGKSIPVTQWWNSKTPSDRGVVLGQLLIQDQAPNTYWNDLKNANKDKLTAFYAQQEQGDKPASAKDESPIVATYPSVEGTEIHVIKNQQGYAVNLWDSDAKEYMPQLRIYSGPDALAKATAYAEDIQTKANPQPAEPVAPTTPAEPAPAPKMTTHVTGKGKTLTGVVRTDISYKDAKDIDRFTFKKDGGYFIREEHLDALNAAHPQAPAEPAPPRTGNLPMATFTRHLATAIREGRMPKDNPALKKLVELYDAQAATPERMKQAQEALESAITMVAREVVDKNEGDQSTFNALLRLYNSQPNLNIRSSTSIENQAYSTPAPLAFLASRLAGITQKTTVLEPTAGNGMLTIGAKIGNTRTNEINDDRVASLRTQGFNPTQTDATQGFSGVDGTFDTVITNPPFGPIKDEAGNSIKAKVDGYTIGQIDHLIAARALQALKDDGSATLIIGANKVTGEQSTNDRIFFNWLYGNYNVTSHFEVDGDLYMRQGAAWPVRVITIQGRNKSSTTTPNPSTINRATSWSEVYEAFTSSLDAQRPIGQRGASPVSARAGALGNDTRPVPKPADGQTGPTGGSRPAGSAAGNGNVSGAGAGTVRNSPAASLGAVGASDGSGRDIDAAAGTGDKPGKPAASQRADAAPGARSPDITAPENQFQAAYVPRSARKDSGVLIPVNMAGPTQDALNRLEDEVGDIDEFTRKELGYGSVAELHDAFMGLQVDSVASAIHQIKKDKGVIIADQTGIGKGRQAAGIIRWAAKNGKIPVFVTVKPSLFTDMYGDLYDIGTDDVNPFILNKDASIKGTAEEKLFANKASVHTALMTKIANTGELPSGSNALFMTYSQINTDNIQRKAVLSLAPNAVFILDESHNAGGASGTGDFIRSALGLASGVTYLSATYAKRPDNMPVYFKTDMGEAVADDATLMNAMASGGLPLQTVVANNLVKAGQMFRRERSYDGVSIESRADTEHRAEHVKMSDTTTLALRAIVAADRTFHANYVKALQAELKASGEAVMDIAGNQVEASVDHTQFSSVVHNFVRQMLLGLKAQEAANDAIRSLKRGEKPLIAVENTMGSFLNEYAESNQISVGDSLGAFTYKTVLSRALERSRYIVRQLPNGDKVKEYIPLGKLDPLSYEAYKQAQDVIDSLDIGIPVSPIDWMRQEIINAGYTVAEVTGRNLSVDYSDPKNPKLSQIDAKEQKDKVHTTRQFNSGKLDSLILNVAGSTGISLHSSEKFTDQRQRHMIVAQAAQDINIFMQTLGRVHRTGQVNLPKYTLLSADLPAEIRPTALLSGKMKSLNANTSSNTESATSVKSSDMLNKYGDRIVAQYLRDNPILADELGLDAPSESGEGAEDIARKATGRLALMPVKVQEQFYAEVEEQYSALIDYLNKTNQNELEPKTFDFEAQETKSDILFEGQNKATPFGEDAIYGEYSVKAQGKAMTPEEIRATMAEHLGGKMEAEFRDAILQKLSAQFEPYYNNLPETQKDAARHAKSVGATFLRDHIIGRMFRVDINGDHYNAVVTNIRNTHKSAGNPYSLSKFHVTIALNGALRSVTVPATQFNQIETSAIYGYGSSIEREFKVGPPNERETAKIVTGNLLGAYGEMEGTRGSIISFTKADGTTEQGILMPKAFNFAKDVRQDYRLKTPSDVAKFVRRSNNENIERFGINSRDNVVRVMPTPSRDGIVIQVPKSKAKGGKYFLDKKLLAATGDFTSQGSFMRATITSETEALAALGVLMDKTALYALPSMAEEARNLTGDTGGLPAFSRGTNSTGLPAEQVNSIVNAIKSRWGNAPDIVVAASMTDPAIPQAVRDYDQTQKSQGATGEPEGFVYRGKVYIVADQMAGANDVMRVLFHESLGHMGLRGVFGERLTPILKQLAALRRADVAAKAKQYGLDMNVEADRLQAAEEVLAVLAQTKPEIGYVQRAIAAIRSWLRANVPGFGGMKLTDADIVAQFILPARRFIEGGNSPKGGQKAPASGTSSTQAAFNRSNAVRAGDVFKAPNGEAVTVMRALPGGKVEVRIQGNRTRLGDFTNNELKAWPKIGRAEYADGAYTTPKSLIDLAKNESTAPDSGGAMFSRSLGASLTAGINNVRDVALPAGYQIGDLFQGEGKLHWWHKTVGSQFHLAEKSPAFKRVYDSIQNFLNDVSFYAAEAADLAPNILPKLDKIGDIFKSPLSAEDTKALSAPVFAGTLTWGRDKNGQAVPMEEIESVLELVPLDERAHMLLQGRHVDPKVLKMWQGLEQDKYEAIINNKFEREFMKPGVVFTPAELAKHFNMTSAQVKLYQEFRKATDKSIDHLAISEMLNYAGKDADGVRDQIIDMNDVEEAGQTLRDYLMSLTDMFPERDKVLSDTAAKMLDIAAHAADMKNRGYAPLSRFGTYTLEATLPTGERYFSLFETDRERNKVRRLLADEGATGITTGTMSQEAYKLLNGISPETAALFGEMLGFDSQGTDTKDVAYQQYIKLGTSNRSAMKRLLHRKGIAGFSEDAGRVLAGFVYSNARRTSSNLHNKETSAAVADIPKEQGELKDAAVKLQEYVSNPQEEMQTFRGILFAQYLGGSVASAMVNATQPFAVTLPYLSQFGGIRKAGAQMAAAVRDATKDSTGDVRLDAALKKAEEEGVVSPQEVHSLQAQAMGKSQLQSGDGTLMGNALAKGNNGLSKLSLAWGKVFGLAEQFNRRTTFIAAYRTAVEQGIARPAEFATKAVNETQFTYNKGNKPRWARGAVGSVLFTFKQYSVNYLELVTRMATAGEPGSAERKAGQKAALLAMAILFLLSGADGLPFVEDVEDVIDGAMQRLGYNFSSKQSRMAFLVNQLGKDGAEFVTTGLSGLPGVPIDVSGRLGMANLIPATGLFIKKRDHTRDLMELAGPGGDFAKRAFTATEQALSGNVGAAITTVAPTAARNVVKAMDMGSTGMYRDTTGKKVIETTPIEAALKGLGFQPRNVKEVQDASFAVQRSKDQYNIAASEIRAKMANAIFMNDADLKQEARDDLATWNTNNPDQRMSLNMPAVLTKVREMRKSKEQRMADTAPKAIRAQVREQLKEKLQ